MGSQRADISSKIAVSRERNQRRERRAFVVGRAPCRRRFSRHWIRCRKPDRRCSLKDLKERVIALYAQHKSTRKVAELLGVSKSHVHRITQKHQRESGVSDDVEGMHRTITSTTVKNLDQLLEAAGVDTDEWAVERHQVNKWDAMTKDGGTREMYQVKAQLVRRPSFWVRRVECKPIPRRPQKNKTQLETCLVIPDSQMGYRRKEDGTLEPLHDVKACDLAIQVAAHLHREQNLTTIVLLGDMLDLAPWSSYSSNPSLRFTTQPALVALHHWLAQLRMAAPSANVFFLEGNHELRIKKVLNEVIAGELHTLRPIDKPDGPSLLSIPYLLSLDKLDVEYIEPYGQGLWWRGIHFHHGRIVRSRGGQTASAMLSNSAHSQVVGHIHRREIASKTIPTDKPPFRKTISAMSPGCLCRLDDGVPQTPGQSQVDWQQGLGIIYADDDGESMQLIPIDNGRIVVDGSPFDGEDRTADLRAATGLPF